MCLAILASKVLPDWPLIVIANRDELHSRPTLPASPWSDAEDILGGRDLSAGGTWLGITAQGRLSLLTNFREPGEHSPQAPSRGRLTDGFLRSKQSPQAYAQDLLRCGKDYNGFNLMMADSSGLWFCSNRGEATVQQLGAGIVGISNASLNTPWPKLTRTKVSITEHLLLVGQAQAPHAERLFEVMQDTRSASLNELPDTGIGPEREKLLGSPFIKNERYGTRCTTLIMQRTDGMVLFHEKSYDSNGSESGESIWTIDTIKQQFLLGSSQFNL